MDFLERFKVGDVVLVLRDEKKAEQAGIVQSIDRSRTGKLLVFVNYGGVVIMVHDKDQIRIVPDDIKDSLKLRLEQNQQELLQEIDKATKVIKEALVNYYKPWWKR